MEFTSANLFFFFAFEGSHKPLAQTGQKPTRPFFVAVLFFPPNEKKAKRNRPKSEAMQISIGRKVSWFGAAISIGWQILRACNSSVGVMMCGFNETRLKHVWNTPARFAHAWLGNFRRDALSSRATTPRSPLAEKKKNKKKWKRKAFLCSIKSFVTYLAIRFVMIKKRAIQQTVRTKPFQPLCLLVTRACWWHGPTGTGVYGDEAYGDGVYAAGLHAHTYVNLLPVCHLLKNKKKKTKNEKKDKKKKKKKKNRQSRMGTHSR